MKTKVDRIVESVFAVANANPKNKVVVEFWLAKGEDQIAYGACARLATYPYVNVSFNSIQATADPARSFKLVFTLNHERPEITP